MEPWESQKLPGLRSSSYYTSSIAETEHPSFASAAASSPAGTSASIASEGGSLFLLELQPFHQLQDPADRIGISVVDRNLVFLISIGPLQILFHDLCRVVFPDHAMAWSDHGKREIHRANLTYLFFTIGM